VFRRLYPFFEQLLEFVGLGGRQSVSATHPRAFNDQAQQQCENQPRYSQGCHGDPLFRIKPVSAYHVKPGAPFESAGPIHPSAGTPDGSIMLPKCVHGNKKTLAARIHRALNSNRAAILLSP
jgi:hypothetical protein